MKLPTVTLAVPLPGINYRFIMTAYRLVADQVRHSRAEQMTELGRIARQVREKLGMTQRAAASALGISSVHLSNVERGVTPPSASLIARFTALYGVDIWVLAYCEGEQGNDPEGVRQARRTLGEALRKQLVRPAKTW